MHGETKWQADVAGWRQRYAETGYLLVENVVDAATLDQLRQGLERIEREVAAGALPERLRRWISLERDRTKGLRAGLVDTDTISNIMELPLFDAVFADFITYPRVLDILEALFETTEFPFHNYKAICKMPGGKAPFQWHRDLPFLQHTTPNLITCMICVDAMTQENGATVVCPGSHRIPYDAVQDSDRDMLEDEVPAHRVTVECPAGSAVLFHVNMVHGGGPNLSQAQRRNVIGIWSGPDAYPITRNRYAYQFVMPRSQDPMRQKQIAMTFSRRWEDDFPTRLGR